MPTPEGWNHMDSRTTITAEELLRDIQRLQRRVPRPCFPRGTVLIKPRKLTTRQHEVIDHYALELGFDVRLDPGYLPVNYAAVIITPTNYKLHTLAAPEIDGPDIYILRVDQLDELDERLRKSESEG